MIYGIKNGRSKTVAAMIAVVPRHQKSRSRHSAYRVNKIAAKTANGISEKLNHEIVVSPLMKNAQPSHAARLLLRWRTNRTKASKTSGIHGEKT